MIVKNWMKRRETKQTIEQHGGKCDQLGEYWDLKTRIKSRAEQRYTHKHRGESEDSFLRRQMKELVILSVHGWVFSIKQRNRSLDEGI